MNEATKAALREAADAIARTERIGAVGHVAPDADALGSSLALTAAARLGGVDAVASFGEPFIVADNFGFMPLDLLVAPHDFPEDLDAVVAFDTASADRLGSLREKAEQAKTLIVVDHHRSNSGFGHVNVIDPEAAAAGELAYHLIRELGWPIDPIVATSLLAALVADTGRFQYSSTTPSVMRLGAELVDLGAKTYEVGQHLFEMAPFGYLKVAAAVLERASLEGSLVWSVLYQEDLVRGGVSYEDTDSLIDQLRIARESSTALLLKELEDGRFKGSLRSRGDVDVGAVAVSLGGGGHHNASGFEMEGSAEDVVAVVQSHLDG